MTVEAQYRNYSHYIDEGWAKEPKRFFVKLKQLIENISLPEKACCLDVGCATGELIAYLQYRFPDLSYTGIDIFEDLITAAKHRVKSKFLVQSVLDENKSMQNKFDLITVMGVMSIFDEYELDKFWKNIFSMAKPGAYIYVFSPLNEFGVDALIKHRKYQNQVAGEWESGWNIYAKETMVKLLDSYCCDYKFYPFQIDIDIAPQNDPIRTWTTSTSAKKRQLTNGLKLLVDHYFIEVHKRDIPS